jgi:hypothetical protein
MGLTPLTVTAYGNAPLTTHPAAVGDHAKRPARLRPSDRDRTALPRKLVRRRIALTPEIVQSAGVRLWYRPIRVPINWFSYIPARRPVHWHHLRDVAWCDRDHAFNAVGRDYGMRMRLCDNSFHVKS